MKKHLTKRQSEVMELLDESLSHKEIGVELHIEKRTEDRHVENLFELFKVHNVTALLKAGKENGEQARAKTA